MAVERYAKHAYTGMTVVGIDLPPAQQEALTDERLPAYLLNNAREQESKGVSAHIIDCFSDPGAELLLSELSTPVVCVGQAGLWYADERFPRFAVITSEQETADKIERNAARWNLNDHLVDILSVEIPAAEVPDDPDLAFAAVERLARGLSDRVDGLVLGCTELAEFSTKLGAVLEQNRSDVRTVNPIAVAIRLAELRLLPENGRPWSLQQAPGAVRPARLSPEHAGALVDEAASPA